MSLPRTLGELQLYRVLQRANLLAYYETFIQQGGDDVQQLCEAAEEEFLEIMALVGMATKPLHVRRLQKALRDWAANPALFSQPVANVPLGGIPLFKVDGTGTSGSAGGPRKSVSNGQPGSPCEREDRMCLTPMHSGSPRSPCSQASPQPPDTHYREKLSPMDPHWLSPEHDGNCTLGSAPGTEEEPSSPPLLSTCPPGPSTSPSPSASFTPAAPSAWPGGQLDGETARAVVETVERLLTTLPRSDPAEVKTLLRMNKKMAKTVGHIFRMGSQDVNKEEEIRKYSLIYGRFDSKRREGKQLTHHELIINEAAAQFCMRDNALLLRRVELFSLARQVARKCAYTSTLKHARTNADESSLLPQKRARLEGVVPESVSSLLGVEGSESLTQRADDDSLSAESLDSVSHDMGSQCNQSPSPRPHTDTSNPASWSRHLIQQTLMDEGLRLARMVSHDRAGKISLGSDGAHATGDNSNHDIKVERQSSIATCRSSSPCVTKDDSNHRGK
ncbi:NGFI-A-binding protein 2 isoform X1 [Simochromis diagramma]|uniref:NGFI-A-binding protein 2 isoform X1 n=1 Tax=Simochromis diagramma TaxID=43689 RepID=UPI001A7F021A|nr:NGFI-A-binding protein 2 isoform X1 [Simochromis diagramma]XP_039885237.1 NGFI-A-binding protein 2 isoform X1 [Simochromis diagramma]XP_039885238.1 NGFI-A-binding protein 2 isoform X1 [Simochromis diagramma]XP_039885239.1 NGFI-A-binding protein 2 isoform X1 [Simochromis diagramma]XP_039885240.1 NGFI-A-binding protein 2 isoform X1 [Simochromis diagramma]XP_039885241.1 NGFI-A-binding protein 2 isoform X1 [Simochromis diagramma]XP_039885242.1 NGFI-A-binding protein 2 isoform X1 [Simochromis d